MDRGWAELAEALRDLGMWRHLPADVAAVEAGEVTNGRYPFLLPDDDLNVRYFYVDGESMAEGNVEVELRTMAPALQRHGVHLQVKRIAFPRPDEGDSVVAINEHHCRIWGPEDWPGYRAWETATVRPLAVVNDLLARARAVPRLFTLNEGVAWLLDPRIVAAVQRSTLLEPGDIRCLATRPRDLIPRTSTTQMRDGAHSAADPDAC